MALQEYHAKRDLKKTPEPIGKIISSKNRLPVFVVQKHDASHLHYDLRLEADGVLKSWAIPKGFSGGRTQKNLAIMVEDHPLEYKNFAGTIRAGNYGAGTVIIWDHGTYAIRDRKNKKDIEQGALEGIKNGRLTFFLQGTKLAGEFALIKIKPRGRENSWLLIKSKAKLDYNPEMEEADKKEYVETKLKHIEIKKTAFPFQVEPMLAKIENQPFDRKHWLFELKLDGYRALTNIKPDKTIELFSRNHIIYNEKFPQIIDILKGISLPCVLDGEIVALNKKGRPDFHALQDYIKTGQGNLIYYVFDILYLEDYDLTIVPLLKRKKILKYLISNYLPDECCVKYLEHIKKNGLELFQAVLKNGMEGIMAKDEKSLYESGRRTGAWLKIKAVKTQEAIIIGLTKPRGGRKYFGSLILAAYDKKNKLRYIGHSGGGFTETDLKNLREKLEKFKASSPPLKNLPSFKNVQWIKPKIICQIKFTGWTPDGLMRQPVFMGLREDKNLQDVKIEK